MESHEEDGDTEMDKGVKAESSESQLSEHRRSERRRKDRQPMFSPDDFMSRKKKTPPVSGSSPAKKRRIVRHRFPAMSAADRPHDILPNGQPFSCDLCQSPFVCNPLLSKGGSRSQRSRHMPSPRQKLNPVTGKLLNLCNACGQSLDGPRPAKPVVQVTQEEKDAYAAKAKVFARDLATRLQDTDADRLYCPSYNKTPCGCLQKYLGAEGEADQVMTRGKELLALYKQAKKLASEKVYNLEELVKKYASKKRAKEGSVGLGNGQKRSRRFEAFILEHRVHLKCDLHLCERAVQRILCYSNNFLHKKLKTDERGSRVVRQKGKAALGLLDSFESLGRRHCCVDQCVRMVYSHRNLLSQWRKRAIMSQNEARRVLAEMLTPSGGVRCNCYKFISWVTGCSHNTISKVRSQMRRTKGDREPPQHGLYSYWERRTHTRKRRMRPSATVTQDTETSELVDELESISGLSRGFDASSFTAMTDGAPVWDAGIDGETESQRQQLLHLQDQLLQRQASISQQQQQVQQQIAVHSNMQQISWSHSASNLASIQQQVLQQLAELQTAQQNLAVSIQTLQQQLASLQPAQQFPNTLLVQQQDSASFPFQQVPVLSGPQQPSAAHPPLTSLNAQQLPAGAQHFASLPAQPVPVAAQQHSAPFQAQQLLAPVAAQQLVGPAVTQQFVAPAQSQQYLAAQSAESGHVFQLMTASNNTQPQLRTGGDVQLNGLGMNCQQLGSVNPGSSNVPSDQQSQGGILTFSQQQTTFSTGVQNFGQQNAKQNLQSVQQPQQTSAGLVPQPPPYIATQPFQPAGPQLNMLQTNQVLQKTAQQHNTVTQQWSLQQQQNMAVRTHSQQVMQPVQQPSQSIMLTFVRPELQQSLQQNQPRQQHHVPFLQGQQHAVEHHLQQSPQPALPQPQSALQSQPPQSLSAVQSIHQAACQLQQDQDHQQLFRPPPYQLKQGGQRQQSSNTLPFSTAVSKISPVVAKSPQMFPVSTGVTQAVMHSAASSQAYQSAELSPATVASGQSAEPTLSTSAQFGYPQPDGGGVVSTVLVSQSQALTQLTLQQLATTANAGQAQGSQSAVQQKLSKTSVSEKGPQQYVSAGNKQMRINRDKTQLIQDVVVANMIQQGQIRTGQGQTAEVQGQTAKVQGQTAEVQGHAVAEGGRGKQNQGQIILVPSQQSTTGSQVQNTAATSTSNTQQVLKPNTFSQPLIITLPQRLACPPSQTPQRLACPPSQTPQQLTLTGTGGNAATVLLLPPSVDLSRLLLHPQGLPGSVTNVVQAAKSSGPSEELNEGTELTNFKESQVKQVKIPVQSTADTILKTVSSCAVSRTSKSLPQTVLSTVQTASSAASQMVSAAVLPQTVLSAGQTASSAASQMVSAAVLPQTVFSSAVPHTVLSPVAQVISSTLPLAVTTAAAPGTVAATATPKRRVKPAQRGKKQRQNVREDDSRSANAVVIADGREANPGSCQQASAAVQLIQQLPSAQSTLLSSLPPSVMLPVTSARTGLLSTQGLNVARSKALPITNLVAHPQNQAAQPGNQVMPPTNQVTSLANQATPPASQVMSPANQAMPPASQTTSPANQATPPANQVTPPANQAMPPANQAMPPANQTMSFANQATPSANQASSLGALALPDTFLLRSCPTLLLSKDKAGILSIAPTVGSVTANHVDGMPKTVLDSAVPVQLRSVAAPVQAATCTVSTNRAPPSLRNAPTVIFSSETSKNGNMGSSIETKLTNRWTELTKNTEQPAEKGEAIVSTFPTNNYVPNHIIQPAAADDACLEPKGNPGRKKTATKGQAKNRKRQMGKRYVMGQGSDTGFDGGLSAPRGDIPFSCGDVAVSTGSHTFGRKVSTPGETVTLSVSDTQLSGRATAVANRGVPIFSSVLPNRSIPALGKGVPVSGVTSSVTAIPVVAQIIPESPSTEISMTKEVLEKPKRAAVKTDASLKKRSTVFVSSETLPAAPENLVRTTAVTTVAQSTVPSPRATWSQTRKTMTVRQVLETRSAGTAPVQVIDVAIPAVQQTDGVSSLAHVTDLPVRLVDIPASDTRVNVFPHKGKVLSPNSVGDSVHEAITASRPKQMTPSSASLMHVSTPAAVHQTQVNQAALINVSLPAPASVVSGATLLTSAVQPSCSSLPVISRSSFTQTGIPVPVSSQTVPTYTAVTAASACTRILLPQTTSNISYTTTTAVPASVNCAPTTTSSQQGTAAADPVSVAPLHTPPQQPPPACQQAATQASQTTPAGFPVSVTPVGEGKRQMMCITSPMNFQQLQVLLSHLQLPVGSVVKQVSSPTKTNLPSAGMGLAEISLPRTQAPALPLVSGQSVKSVGHVSASNAPSTAVPSVVAVSESLTQTNTNAVPRNRTKPRPVPKKTSPADNNRGNTESRKNTSRLTVNQSDDAAKNICTAVAAADSKPKKASDNAIQSRLGPTDVSQSITERSGSSNVGRIDNTGSDFPSVLLQSGQSPVSSTSNRTRVSTAAVKTGQCFSAKQHTHGAFVDSVRPPAGTQPNKTAPSTTMSSRESLRNISPCVERASSEQQVTCDADFRPVALMQSPIHRGTVTTSRPSARQVPSADSVSASPRLPRTFRWTGSISPENVSMSAVDFRSEIASASQNINDVRNLGRIETSTTRRDQRLSSGQNKFVTSSSGQNFNSGHSDLLANFPPQSVGICSNQVFTKHRKNDPKTSKPRAPETRQSFSPKAALCPRSGFVQTRAESDSPAFGDKVVQQSRAQDSEVFPGHGVSKPQKNADATKVTATFNSRMTMTSSVTERPDVPVLPVMETDTVTLHTLSNVPHSFTADTATATTAFSPFTTTNSATVVVNSHHNDNYPFYTSAMFGDRLQTTSPPVPLPPSEADDMSRDIEFFSGPGIFPFLSTSSRSRNSSGASSIEPSITIDPALLSYDLMQMMTHQGLAVAVTEVVPSGGGDELN